jgi:hypothetical protein
MKSMLNPTQRSGVSVLIRGEELLDIRLYIEE